MSIPLVGAGSATYHGHEGVWLFEVGEEGAFATRGRWTGERYDVSHGERERLDSPCV